MTNPLSLSIHSYQGAFNFPFHIGKNSLSIVQHGDRFELRINNQSFEHLYNQSKWMVFLLVILINSINLNKWLTGEFAEYRDDEAPFCNGFVLGGQQSRRPVELAQQ